jgi:hypothetical protein
MSELNNLREYKDVRVSDVEHDFSQGRHEDIPHQLYADWSGLIIKLAKAVFPSFVEPPFPASLKFQTESTPSDGPYSANADYYMLDYVFCELKAENGHGLKISFENGRQGGDNPVSIETLGFNPGVSSHIYKEAKSPLATIYVWQTEEQSSEIAEIIARHRESCLAKPIQKAVPDHLSKDEKCSLCGIFPDDLTVNTGRDEYFPDAFWKQIRMELGSDDYEEFRRCPGCGSYFKWIDSPQMYGSGNLAEERLIRFPLKASPLLDLVFSPDGKEQPDLGEIDEYFKFIELELLLDVLRLHARYAPKIFELFVPYLWRLLFRNDTYSVQELLSCYISDEPERAEAVLASLQALQAGRYHSPLSDALLYCFAVAGKKK